MKKILLIILIWLLLIWTFTTFAFARPSGETGHNLVKQNSQTPWPISMVTAKYPTTNSQ
jgi:uncharacterized protein YxeA